MRIRLSQIRTAPPLAALSCSLLSLTAHADTEWTLDAGVARTNNATLSPTDKVSDTLPSVGGSVAYELDSRRIKSSLHGYGDYVHYVEGTFDDEFTGRAVGSVVLGVVPEHFLWTVDDTYGQIATNQFEPVTPDNRQNVNNFRTGPDLVLRLGDQSSLRFAGRYGNSKFGDSRQINTDTWNGSVSFQRSLSRNSSWGLVASQTRIEYDTPTIPAYDQPSLYAMLESNRGGQSLSVNVGVNRVDIGNQSSSSPLVRVGWKRQVAPSWTLNLDLSSEYQNTAQRFTSQAMRDVPGDTASSVSTVPAASYHGGLSFAFERTRTRLRLGGSYSKLEYVDNTGLDEKSWRAFAEVSRRLRPDLRAFLNYSVDRRTYAAVALRNDDKQSADAGLDWNFGRSTFLTVGYRYADSNSDSPINNYSASIYYLRISYRQGGLEAVRPAGF